jgi:hypothetical protein
MATRKEIQHNAEFEKSAFCFELARWLVARRDAAHRQGAPLRYRNSITLKTGALLERLRADSHPQNVEKLPKTTKQLFKTLRALEEPLKTRGITAERRYWHGHRRVYLTYPPASVYPLDDYPTTVTQNFAYHIHTGQRARARTNPETGQYTTAASDPSKRTGKQKKQLVEDCFRTLTAREAAHVPNIETRSTSTGTARTPFVVCPKCRERRRKLYKPTPRDRWLCRRCHELTFRSSQEHATNHSFTAALWTTGDPVQERYNELFYPAYGEAADKHIAAGKPRYELDYLANRIGKEIREKLKAEWLAEQRTAANPRAKKEPP